MSKRMSTTKLDHENWDVEEPPEEAGTFSSATTEVLKKRTILKAQRRSRTTASGESGTTAVPNIFQNIKLTSNSSATPSFSFLGKKANENKKSENLVSKAQPSFVFSSTTTSTQASDKTGESTFTFASSKTAPVSESSTTITTPKSDTSSSLAIPKSQASGPAVEATTTTQTSSNVFGTTTVFTNIGTTSTTDSNKPVAPPSQALFGNVFGNSVGKSSVEKSETKTDTGQFSFGSSDKKNEASTADSKKLSSTESANKKADSSSSDRFIDKDKYYLMLKGLNSSVAKWIKENVDKNPHCILTPIFTDYITHLNEIKAKYGKVKADTSSEKVENVLSVLQSSPSNQDKNKALPSNTFMVNGNDKDKSTKFLLPLPQTSTPLLNTSTEKPQASTPFTFSAFASQTTFPKPDTSTQSPFSTVDKSCDPVGSSSNPEVVAESKTEKADENNDEDDAEPTEPAPTPVVEDGAVYSKRCKVFVKKSGSYQDRGVGTIFIKPVVENTKTQLIVRADTVLGNVLLNTLIISSLPIQRLGPNNVMVVCVPTPDEKPPPATVLLRVKTAADADELYEKLLSYKK